MTIEQLPTGGTRILLLLPVARAEGVAEEEGAGNGKKV